MDTFYSGKELAMREFPIFADLTADEAAFIKERSLLVEYPKGAVVYEEGAPPSAFYGLVSGRMEIAIRGRGGEKTVLEYLHRGTYFGIISLLTNEPHSVTAQTLNECVLLQINKKDFDDILKAVPRIAIDVSRMLSRRLKRKDVHQKTVFESTILSVFSAYPHAGKSMYAQNLALSLARETGKSVILVDIIQNVSDAALSERAYAPGAQLFDISSPVHAAAHEVRSAIARGEAGTDVLRVRYAQVQEGGVKRLAAALSLLVNDYHYIVLDMPAVLDDISLRIVHQADQVHVLSGRDELDVRRTQNLVQKLRDEYQCPADKIHVVINERGTQTIPRADLPLDVLAELPHIAGQPSGRLVLDDPGAPYSSRVRAVARKVGGRQVGLVLGIGVAYGLCHVGVLKVIEEERIPIDVIAGSSIGAFIAGLWAVGYSSAEILRITGEFRTQRDIWGLIDLTFPSIGFIRGKRLYHFIRRHLGDRTFSDARLPLRIIASDVKKKEPKVFDRGSLVDAITASCAMPGVFAPFRMKEDLLLDGGLGHPLPTEPLVMMGVKKIIAVNVTPSREDVMRRYERMKSDLSGPRSKGLAGFVKSRLQNNILDIIFSSVEMLQSEIAQKEAQFADVVLHPDTSGLFWTELHRAPEFARRGEAEARRQLELIRKVVDE